MNDVFSQHFPLPGAMNKLQEALLNFSEEFSIPIKTVSKIDLDKQKSNRKTYGENLL